jgi:hypothetical protein
LKVIEGYISHSRRIFVDCLRHQAGLPDGIFSKQKCQTGYILEGLTIEDFGHILCPFGLFYCHLVYLIAIWAILLPFGLFCGCLVNFVVICFIFPVLVCCTKKNLVTLPSSALLFALNRKYIG